MNRGVAPRTGGPGLPELGIRLFRALYDAYDLIIVGGVNIAVPKDGTIPVVTGTLTEIAGHASPWDGVTGRPGRACLDCGTPDPPPEMTCTLGRDHRVGAASGCPCCLRLTAACTRRPCSAVRADGRRGAR